MEEYEVGDEVHWVDHAGDELAPRRLISGRVCEVVEWMPGSHFYRIATVGANVHIRYGHELNRTEAGAIEAARGPIREEIAMATAQLRHLDAIEAECRERAARPEATR